MADSEAGVWVLWHAGFLERRGATVPSIWEASRSGDAETLSAALDDLVAAFVALNRDLNGDVPSASVGSESDSVPRSVAAAVSEISQLLRRYPGSDPVATKAVWVVDVAWDAVVAGDIDDLEEHLRLEALALPTDQFDG